MAEIFLGVEGVCNMYMCNVHLAIGVLRSFGALQAVVSWSVHVLHVSKPRLCKATKNHLNRSKMVKHPFCPDLKRELAISLAWD